MPTLVKTKPKKKLVKKVAKKHRRVISLDTEGTGLDYYHGARPFFVTFCENGVNTFFEWSVDPLTRKVLANKKDLLEIQAIIDSADELVLQNSKFDQAMLDHLFRDFGLVLHWPWKKVRDTLVAGHVLASNQPHDLTTMSLIYLEANIKPFEDAIDHATIEARKIVNRKCNHEHFPEWRIAKQGLSEMPSVKGKSHKLDMWLPRAVVLQVIRTLNFDLLPLDLRQPTVGKVSRCTVRIDRQSKWGNPFKIGPDGDREECLKKYAEYILKSDLIYDLPELYGQILGCHCAPDNLCHGDILRALCHPWFTVLQEYGNTDSTVTGPLHEVQERALRERDCWEIYLTRLKVVPAIHMMESVGVTVNREWLERQDKIYREESARINSVCCNIAKSYGGYQLELPNGGSNKSLEDFVFGITPRPIIYVFGSNREGRHGAGCALEAKKNWGAVYGQCEGRQGNSYAIVTKELRTKAKPVTLEEVEAGVIKFLDYAKRHPELAFQVAPIGCGLAGFKPKQIAPLFKGKPRNVLLPKEFGGNGVVWGMDLPVLKKTPKGGKPSLDKDTLEKYENTLKLNSKPYNFIKNFRLKRVRDTAIGFIASYRKYWIKLEQKGWFTLHPSHNQTGTGTCRGSGSNPNGQQISKKEIAEEDGEKHSARHMFGPKAGREWWSCDAKNIELRLPSYESGEEAMIFLFEHPDDPPYYGSNHLLNFDILHPDLYAKHGKDVKKIFADTWYSWTKNGDFAVQYGAMETSGTADRAFHVPGAHAKIAARLGKIKDLNQQQIAHAEKHGYVYTMPDKTVNPRHGYPLLCTRTKWGGIKPTVPLSYHVQGTAGWWMNKAMIRCYEFLTKFNKAKIGEVVDGVKRTIAGMYYMILQIHDELLFDFPKNYKEVDGKPVYGNMPVINKIVELMEMGGDDINVPTPVSCEYHPVSWAEGIVLR